MAKSIYVLYDNDPDGFGAAYAAWKKWGRNAKFFHLRTREGLPEMPSNAEIYIVDGSPASRAELLSMRQRYRRVVVIDHHESAFDAMGDLPDVHIDLTRSAAVLAWQYFHPGVKVPELLLYIEDRDIWKNELPGTHEVSAALESYPKRFEIWDELNVQEMKEEGAAILRMTGLLVKRICAQAREDYVADFRVPVVNATAFVSDVCHLLLQRYPQAPFAAAYYDLADGKRKWSLRSRGDFDVKSLAVQMGGGGHRAAAGFVSKGEGKNP